MEKEHQHGNGRNDPQAAELDQDQNDDLAEEAPVGIGIHHDQTRHTDRRGGSEQRGEEIRLHPFRRGGGKKEQQRSHGDSQQKAEGDDVDGRKTEGASGGDQAFGMSSVADGSHGLTSLCTARSSAPFRTIILYLT